MHSLSTLEDSNLTSVLAEGVEVEGDVILYYNVKKYYSGTWNIAKMFIFNLHTSLNLLP